EDRPVARELYAPGDAKFFLVAQVLDRCADVAIEAKVTNLGICFIATDGEIELVATNRQIVLIHTESVCDVDKPTVPHPRPADEIGKAVGEAGTFRENPGATRDAVALTNRRADGQVRPIERPVESVSYARRIFPAIVAREAAQCEQVAVLEIDRAGILVGNR